MSNTCKTPEGTEFNQEHKEIVNDFINSNNFIFTPQTNEIPTNTDDSNPDDPIPISSNQTEVGKETKDTEEVTKTITSEEIKKHVKKTPNKAPGDKIFVQH